MALKIIITAPVHSFLVDTLKDKGYAIQYEPTMSYEALLDCIETATGLIVTTRLKIDAAILSKAHQLKWIGRIGSGMELIDVAYAKTKGIQSIVAGEPDLLLVPDLQVGNILYKALIYMAGAECAGVILGAQVPIILTSRADSVFSRVASTALALRLAAQP